jgi:hypothetical protein
MQTIRASAAMARTLLALVVTGATMLLAACGGGSGAPNNPYAPTPVLPGPLTVLPGAVTAYSGNPVVFTISGGTPPYRVFSSNSAVMPVSQDVSGTQFLATPASVDLDTEVAITAQDSSGTTATAVATVKPSALVNGLQIAAEQSPTTCGGLGSVETGAVVCSGDTGTAKVRLLGAGGSPLPGRTVRFEVVQGDFSFYTGDPARPLALSVNVVTDQSGTAIARFQAAATAPSAFALIRATDVTSTNSVVSTFTIAQVTDGSNSLTVVPAEATITATYKDECSAGFRTDYFVYGGTPPYRISQTFPDAALLERAPVQQNGGSFRVTTNGTCVDPMQLGITDATGRTITAKLINKPGDSDRPTTPTTPPSLLQLSPKDGYTSSACTGATFPFVVIGGTRPYNVSALVPGTGGAAAGVITVDPANPVAPQILNVSGGKFTVSGLTTGSGVVTVTVVDSGSGANQQVVTSTITCN